MLFAIPIPLPFGPINGMTLGMLRVVGERLVHTKFEFGELFTGSVRRMVPRLDDRRLRLLFDYEGPQISVQADASQWDQGLRRVFDGAIAMLQEGFVLLTARVDDGARARCRISVAAAASGSFTSVDARRQVLNELQMQGVDELSDDALWELKAPVRATCPYTGGALQFFSDPADGSLFSLVIESPAVRLDEPVLRLAGAPAPRAWLIGEDDVHQHALERRLQRLGWATRCFESVAETVADLQAQPAQQGRPALVIAEEGGAVTLDALAPLAQLLPAQSQLVLAVSPHSLTQARAGGDARASVRVHPFSPADLRGFTLDAVGAPPPSGLTQPAPLSLDQRLRALVVDDNVVNQMVATGMLQMLGFEVETADDGEAAIDLCLRQPPHLVLMDLHMPGMDGFEATRRLRLLQREGTLPAFPILAATADVTAQQACTEAGLDAHLPKPIDLNALEEQVKRLVPQGI
jgi:CheY-like chemotaxis protein